MAPCSVRGTSATARATAQPAAAPSQTRFSLVSGQRNAQRQLPSKIGAAQALPPHHPHSSQPPSCAVPTARRRPATYAQPAQVAPFSAQCCAASTGPRASARWEALARSGPPQPAQPCRTHLDAGQPARRRRRTGGARVSSACGAETCRGVLALRSRALRQQPTARSLSCEARSRGARVRHGGARCRCVLV